MTIQELIEMLQQYDTEKTIYVWNYETEKHDYIDGVSLFDEDEKHDNNNPLAINIYGSN